MDSQLRTTNITTRNPPGNRFLRGLKFSEPAPKTFVYPSDEGLRDYENAMGFDFETIRMRDPALYNQLISEGEINHTYNGPGIYRTAAGTEIDLNLDLNLAYADLKIESAEVLEGTLFIRINGFFSEFSTTLERMSKQFRDSLLPPSKLRPSNSLQRNDKSFFESLGKDVFSNMAMVGKISHTDIINTCSTSLTVREWCDDTFFRNLYLRDIGGQPIENPGRFVTFRDAYMHLHRPKAFFTGAITEGESLKISHTGNTISDPVVLVTPDKGIPQYFILTSNGDLYKTTQPSGSNSDMNVQKVNMKFPTNVNKRKMKKMHIDTRTLDYNDRRTQLQGFLDTDGNFYIRTVGHINQWMHVDENRMLKYSAVNIRDFAIGTTYYTPPGKEYNGSLYTIIFLLGNDNILRVHNAPPFITNPIVEIPGNITIDRIEYDGGGTFAAIGTRGEVLTIIDLAENYINRYSMTLEDPLHDGTTIDFTPGGDRFLYADGRISNNEGFLELSHPEPSKRLTSGYRIYSNGENSIICLDKDKNIYGGELGGLGVAKINIFRRPIISMGASSRGGFWFIGTY